jgi:hypothetical protein
MTPSTPIPPTDPAGEPPSTRVEKSTGVQVGSGNEQHIHHYPNPNSSGTAGGGVARSWPVRVGTVPLGADCYQDRHVSLAVQEGVEHEGTVAPMPAATTVVAGMDRPVD